MRDVLLAIDPGDDHDAVLGAAERMARLLMAPLHIVHVAEPDPEFVGYEAGPDSVRESVAGELREEHRTLEAITARLRNRGIEASYRLRRGATADEILAAAEAVDAVMIVVGTAGRNAIAEALLGSVSHAVLRRAHRPVLVVPAGGT